MINVEEILSQFSCFFPQKRKNIEFQNKGWPVKKDHKSVFKKSPWEK